MTDGDVSLRKEEMGFQTIEDLLYCNQGKKVDMIRTKSV